MSSIACSVILFLSIMALTRLFWLYQYNPSAVTLETGFGIAASAEGMVGGWKSPARRI
jgi:hypothetical protein